MSRAPAEPDASASVLDETALARLRELDPDGRHGVVTRVLGTYEAALVRQIEQLRGELAAPRAAPLGALAHTLKSSSASVGALPLSRACAALEQRVRQGGAAQTHDVAELISLAESALAGVRTILRG
jgi:HPt (histidine-containing phosphotransfer) domain-containing protein